jgi:hypothetical protein
LIFLLDFLVDGFPCRFGEYQAASVASASQVLGLQEFLGV